MHHPTDRITHTTAFVTLVMEHWLEREIAQWVHPIKDRSDNPSHHERTLLPRSYISLRVLSCQWHGAYKRSTAINYKVVQKWQQLPFLHSTNCHISNVHQSHGPTDRKRSQATAHQARILLINYVLITPIKGWKMAQIKGYTEIIRERNLLLPFHDLFLSINSKGYFTVMFFYIMFFHTFHKIPLFDMVLMLG